MVFSFFGVDVPGRVVDLLCASLLRDFFLSSLGSLGKGVRLFQGEGGRCFTYTSSAQVYVCCFLCGLL